MAFGEALEDYRRTATALFAASGDAGLADDAPNRAEELLIRSQELERTAAADLASGSADVRELAALQLAASAALDIATAVDLIRQDAPAEAGLESAGGPGANYEAALAELEPVLTARTALGAREALAALSGPEDVALEGGSDFATIVHDALKSIGDDAAAITGHAVDGLKGIPGDALLGAFGNAADKLLTRVVAKLGRIKRAVVNFLVKAVSKLLHVLGPLEETAREWLADKLGEITQDKIVAFAVDHALELPQLREELDAALPRAATADKARLDAAGDQVADLARRFGQHELVIKVIAGLVEKVRGWILGLAQWAAAALAAVYVAVLLYGIWVAGDFLDWYRTRAEGRLDIVDGVRSVVLDALGPQAA